MPELAGEILVDEENAGHGWERVYPRQDTADRHKNYILP
jgi:hypothetical protein